MDEDFKFTQVVTKMEVYVIQDPSIFENDHNVNGFTSRLQHPDSINKPNERWIDLTGEKIIYLKILFDDSDNYKKNPITDFNFFWISRYKSQPDKMSIHKK